MTDRNPNVPAPQKEKISPKPEARLLLCPARAHIHQDLTADEANFKVSERRISKGTPAEPNINTHLVEAKVSDITRQT
jgi:hypothetical protein